MSKLTTASVLAFERNLDISDGFMAQKNSKDEQSRVVPVRIQEKSVRGTISNRLKNTITNDPAKLDAEIEKANLQKVDSASLLEENDTLVVSWTCKVLPFDGKPNVCNDQAYQAKLLGVVQGYLEEHGVSELAHRYATNIANARWLWRNRVGAEKITVSVTCQLADQEQTLTFDAKSISIHNFETQSKELSTLADWIEQGLTNQAFIILNIKAEAIVGFGQEVYPSQELILDTGKTKSKILYSINDKAGIHSQKIGNAIRTIDTWYPEAEFPIAVEPYGAVTTMGVAFRQPKQKQDFYSLFDGWVLKDDKPSVENQHYVMAVLVRGGVFGASGKE
ncbi:type I-F CRISPR-associated protein Csy3 [Moraxella canis]|uniref:Type I-F CRISPR-associated protein Csy3 n=1 Tax=Moraxella canis TaxID=90239 RepID=A0ABZ0WV97_9GAMM|nr:type I-F CRISPR-associated protein Csy3 [Moraxella canis]WQE03148.1 type I-F CRISPR-associated protein Csy3 [Moraxella canis]